MTEGYEICDRCGGRMLVGNRHSKSSNVVDIFILCNACMEEIRVIEDRNNVLEGWVEEVGKMTLPIK